MSEVRLQVKNLCKNFGITKAVQNVSFNVNKGEVHALIGENGSGKSTLTNMLTGIYSIGSGQFILDGKEIHPKNQVEANNEGVSIIVQELGTLSGLTVAENIFLGHEDQFVHLGIKNTAAMNKKANELLQSYGFDKIKAGDSVVLDIGGKYNSYCSDMTRTVFIGKEPSKEHADIYNIVKSANEKAISIIKEGVKFSDIDNAARNIIKDAGYGEYFTHRTGHSIGIEVHDFGDVSAVNHEEVKAGMIFSVEPGIYLKDNIGVRIEDLVLVTKDGCEVLNSVTKEIVVL